MTNFYTSDNHFDHKNIIRYCNRPFASVEEMNEEMIKRWNAVVSDDDDVYHLGDFAMGKTHPSNFLRRLKGRKHFIPGNHDSEQTKGLKEWESVSPYMEVREAGKFIVLCHYKFEVFNKSHYGALNFYGHSHGTLPGNNQQIDVGVDCWDYTPVTLDQILARMKTLKPWKTVDHHKSREM